MNSKSAPYNLCLDTLANELRVNIIKSLADSPKTVQELADELHVEQSRLSHSLRALRTCHHVEVKPHGKQRVYTVKSHLLRESQEAHKNLFDALEHHYHAHCHSRCDKANGGCA